MCSVSHAVFIIARPTSGLPHHHSPAPSCRLPDPVRRPDRVRCRSQAVSTPAQTARRFADFVPAEVAGIQEDAALDLAARLERLPVNVPSLDRRVDTAIIAPASSSRSPTGVVAYL